jgi:hypothetical protein
VRIHDLLELGECGKYNKLFAELSSSNIVGAIGSTVATTFKDQSEVASSGIHHQLLIGVDGSRGAFIRPVARQHDSGGSFVVMPDDQFNVRADKVGFWGFLEEGRICIDSRAIAGLTLVGKTAGTA